MSNLLISTHLYEKRPLKKPKLGPPDVYPQDPKQKEDELTPINVKQGYCNINSTLLQDEYGTARNANITSGRFGEYFSSILAKKHELNTFNDTSKKKHVLNKDSTIFVTPKTKNTVETFFKELASNVKSLTILAKKVPFYNKREEIFATLYEYSIPMLKAQWFLKLSNAHQMSMSESNNKSKKRQLPDPAQEWTNSLCKFLKEHYLKIMDNANNSNNISNNSFSSMNNHNQPQNNLKELLNQWFYYTKLAKYLYEEGLLDRHDFLFWLLELFEKIKSIDDPMLNLLAPMLVQYVNEFTQSEFLSRHLAFHCAKKISQLVDYCNEFNETEKENNKDNEKSSVTLNLKSSTNELSTTNAKILTNSFKEIILCSKYQELLFSLSTVIQVITLECPTALVWHNFDNTLYLDSNPSNKVSLLHGSPLDYLPCEPSNLPIPPLTNVARLRSEIRNSENLIRCRSINCEKKWFYKTFLSVSSQNSVGNVVNRLLDVLDCLDKHLFDKVTSENSLDKLYNKIFNTNFSSEDASLKHDQSNNATSKTLNEIINEDISVVKLLCEWAVTTKRLGEYRSRVVAKLLERRQNDILNEKDIHESNNTETLTDNIKNSDFDDKENNNINNITNDNTASHNCTNKTTENDIPFIYQQILFEFLDSYAPVTEDKTLGIFFPANAFPNNCQADNKQAFNNLVLLFAELIRHEVFSHDNYMRTLISRGHFVNPPSILLISSTNTNHSKNSNEDSLTGLLPSSMDNVSNGGLMIHKSTSSSSLPMFDPLSNNSNLNSNEHLGSNMFSMNDNLDEDKLDEDLDKILQNIKAGQQSKDDQNDILLPDAMESDKEDETNGPNSVNANSTSLSDLASVNKNHLSEQISPTARHLLYTLHFPLPQDESFVHEFNQRHILLYGVGKTKDEQKHIVRKVTKEIQKLFNRKSSMDISDNGKVKKHVIKEGFNFENAIAKFQNLSIFDQHAVTNSCASTVLEMLNGIVLGSANHLPLIESIAFLFDLMEIALNVNGLVEFIVHMIKELVDVEIVLHQKCSIQYARPYCTSIGLYIVGVLNRYHNYVVASTTEDIFTIFDGLLKLVRHCTPSDCSSAERCIFFYLDDLNSSCNYLLKKYQDFMRGLSEELKNIISIRDDTSVFLFNTSCIMMQYLKNPREKVDSIQIRQLNENSSDRYSLVCNAIVCITEANDMDYLNELSVLCAELTASCCPLASEWFNAFQALCNPNCTNGYISLLTQINIGDRTIYDNLAVFVSILVARRCFALEELIYRVFIPSLLIPTVDTGDETERRARLCCHLILYLFKYYDSPLAASNSAMNSSFASSSRYSLTSPGPLGLSTVAPALSSGQKSPFIIKYACDRYLLGGALNLLRLELIITLLKAIFVLGTQEKKGCNFKSDKSDFDSIYKPMGGDDEFGDRTYLSQMTKSKETSEKPSLSDFAKYVLRQICLQDWVHDRCLHGFMIQPSAGKRLFDKKISYKDSQCLLNMICYHKQILPSSSSLSDKVDTKQIIHIFQNLDEWSLRISWLQLNLIYENLATNQSSSNNEMIAWMETLAPAIVEYFQQTSHSEPVLDSKHLTMFTSKSSTMKNNIMNFGGKNERIWLLKPLISKLPAVLQCKILRVVATVFDSSNWILYSQGPSGSMSSKSKSFQNSKNSNALGITLNSQNPTSTLLSNQPFVSMLLMCLDSKDDVYKESLLKSLHNQLQQCINEKLSDDIRAKNLIQEGLQYRLSLLGAIFETIKSSTSFTNDWVVLLAQLISYTIVDPHINYVNFSTVLDMLTSLMHHSYSNNVLPEQREETKKLNQNLIRKLKKELTIEQVSMGVRMAKQLLPIVKHQAEVIACEAMGSLVDTKGNKIAGFDSIDRKQGFQASEKQKISPWDLIEGHKNSAPLSWTWFGAIKMERKPLRMEENFCLLARHDHNIAKPFSFYMEAPPIPPEDDPIPAQVPIMPQQQPIQQSIAYNSPVMVPNGTNIPVQSGPHLNNLAPQTSFNSPNGMHSIHQPPPPPAPNSNMQTNFQYINPIGMNSNNLAPPPSMQPSQPTNVMHSAPIVTPQQQHLMNSNEPSLINQAHPMIVNSMNNSSMMSMPMDMMDIQPGSNLAPAIQSGPIPPGLRPSMANQIPMQSIQNVNTRAQTPKKPKATRKRRNTKNQQANNVPTIPNQPAPIRMANSFDNYNSNSMNSQNTGNQWAYQNTQQSNMNANNQGFYQSRAASQNQAVPAMMIAQQQQQPARFQEQMQNTSKVRLRAMLNTRHPNSNQFNLNQNDASNTVVNSGPMINNQQSAGNMFPARHSMPQMIQKAQIRSQSSMQSNQSISNQNAMFQQQQQQINQGNATPMHHSMQQAPNFGPQNVAYNNNLQTMDNSITMTNNSNNYQQTVANPQANIMMRSQMPINSQQSNSGQFMQQRSQFSNFSGHQAQQQMLNSNGQHWSQPNQIGPNRGTMTQLQRQLSAPNQGQLQGSHTPYPY